MEHGIKFVLLYWLKDKSVVEEIKEAMWKMKDVSVVRDMVVGTPSEISDDVVDGSYDLGAVITIEKKEDFHVLFESEAHMSMGKAIAERKLAEKMQGFMITY